MTRTSDALLDHLAAAARGARREGVFAVWLLIRAAEDECLDPPLSAKGHTHRLEAIERRLASLSLPAPLRRALPAALVHLREPGPRSAALALQLLSAPVRDALGEEAAEVVVRGASAARNAYEEAAQTRRRP